MLFGSILGCGCVWALVGDVLTGKWNHGQQGGFKRTNARVQVAPRQALDA